MRNDNFLTYVYIYRAPIDMTREWFALLAKKGKAPSYPSSSSSFFLGGGGGGGVLKKKKRKRKKNNTHKMPQVDKCNFF